MTKWSSLYHLKTGQTGPIFKMASENLTVQKPDKFVRFLNGIRKPDRSTTRHKSTIRKTGLIRFSDVDCITLDILVLSASLDFKWLKIV
jgi:hypothetical protein